MGGVFHCTSVISAREGAPTATRVRARLRDNSDAYDMVLVGNRANTLLQHFSSSLISANAATAPLANAQLRQLADQRVEQLEFVTIVLKRHAEDRGGFTFVADRGSETGWRDEEPWVAERGRISVDTPFVGHVDVGAGDAMMLAQFEGTRTLHEHVLALKANGTLPPDTDAEHFARSFSRLVLDGVVESAVFVR